MLSCPNRTELMIEMVLAVLLCQVLITTSAANLCDNCKNTLVRPKLRILQTTPLKHFKCKTEYFKWLKSQQPENNDASTILYKPAEESIVQYFPAYFYPFTYDTDTHSSYQTNKFEDTVGSITPKFKRKPTFAIRNYHKKNTEPFVILDINVHSKSDVEATHHIKDLFQNNFKELTENKIKDCFDLYLIEHNKNGGIKSPSDNTQDVRETVNIHSQFSDGKKFKETNNKLNGTQSTIYDSEIMTGFTENSFIDASTEAFYVETSKSNSEAIKKDQDGIATTTIEDFFLPAKEDNCKDDTENSRAITNRTKYSEGEYVIPKIVTSEFSNDTIVSEIQGNTGSIESVAGLNKSNIKKAFVRYII